MEDTDFLYLKGMTVLSILTLVLEYYDQDNDSHGRNDPLPFLSFSS